MSLTTPHMLARPVAAYFAAANAHDSDATVACFTDNAVVRDEKHEFRGAAAIHAWKVDVDAKYRATTEVIKVVERQDSTIVTGRVSGNFPGSPIDLEYRFALDGERISLLEIR